VASQPRRRESLAERRDRRAEIDDPAVVLEAAARFLEARSRSVAEVRRRLVGAGYRPELVEGAIARMTELGMLDDEVFARSWVESRDRARPRGERAIREELRLKGVDHSSIDLVLAERREAVADPDNDTISVDGAGGSAAGPDRAAAERLIEKHRRILARVADPRKRMQRAYALLARNGFDADVCSAAAARVVSGEDPGEPD
jgi:regulatory protein